ncbi:hypothetical protein [Erythrobacter sp. JK5]|uniref:TA system antitoxin ParD family protein n=1 Tax=Erythrobacter sp. JK5 TaxID=2829500 RepID=UPI001BAA5093|nr:hypothetical protein [Erythrobacter sp. JK5]QUL37047.1 hypothetical protein KDC96_11665 [Erythrobacter sp. JK5]
MSRTVKIDEELVELISREAKLMSRSLAGQVRHWVRIGMNVEKSRFFNSSLVADALNGRIGPDALTTEEQESFVEGLFDAARDGTPEQAQFFADRRARGLGAGLTDDAETRKAGRGS